MDLYFFDLRQISLSDEEEIRNGTGTSSEEAHSQDSPIPSRYLYRPSEEPSTTSEEEALASSDKENVEPARTCDAEPSDDGGGWTRVVRKGRSRSAKLQEKFQKLEIKETPDVLLATRKDECRPPLTAREELEKLLEDSELTHHSRAGGERPLRAFSARTNTRSFGCDDNAPPNRYAVLRNLGEEARSGGEDMDINSGCEEEYVSDLDNYDELHWESVFRREIHYLTFHAGGPGYASRDPFEIEARMGKGRRRWERHHPERAARMNAEVEYWNKRCNERNEDQKLARNQAADELSTRAEALDSLRTYNELWKPETFIERTLKRNFSEFNSQDAEEVVHAYDNSDSDEMLDALASPLQKQRILQAQRFVLEERDRRRRLLYRYESESEMDESYIPKSLRLGEGGKAEEHEDAQDPPDNPRRKEALRDEKLRVSSIEDDPMGSQGEFLLNEIQFPAQSSASQLEKEATDSPSRFEDSGLEKYCVSMNADPASVEKQDISRDLMKPRSSSKHEAAGDPNGHAEHYERMETSLREVQTAWSNRSWQRVCGPA